MRSKKMICCKIIADYKQQSLEFVNILNELNKIGDVLFDDRYFYFANTDDDKISKKNIQRIFKKFKCDEIFIESYDQQVQPNENEYVNWWVEDKLIKIGYNEFEMKEQEKIQYISKQLTELEELIQKAKEKSAENVENK